MSNNTNLSEIKPWEWFAIFNPNLYNELNSSILNSFSQTSFRTFDGSSNNMSNPAWGKAGQMQKRICTPDYGPDGVAVRGVSNPNPRTISNLICQGTSLPSDSGLTDMVWVWGQFLDHCITITDNQEGADAEKLPITTPPDDAYPGFTIPFTRSVFKNIDGVRQQFNAMSSFIDGTNVYGTTIERAYALRTLDGTGKMKTTIGDNGELLLPYNTEGLPNSSPQGSDPLTFYLAGDVRANEVSTLLGIHTLFVREHNRLCDQIIKNEPGLVGQDEMIYQKARRWVVAFMQNITYNEYLPALLGGKTIQGSYNKDICADMCIEFSTAGFRLGHTMVSSEVQVGSNPSDVVLVRNIFFNPNYVKTNGVDNILFGVTQKLMQNIDNIVVEDLRTFLFGPPEMGMLHDLVALNIQRGRDHGLAGYNAIRASYGLSTFSNFTDIPTSVDIQNKLASLYDSVDDIDPWIGMVIENHLPGEAVGELIHTVLIEQFTRLKLGDRCYFENDPAFTGSEKSQIRMTKLSDILNRNTKFMFKKDVFHL